MDHKGQRCCGPVRLADPAVLERRAAASRRTDGQRVAYPVKRNPRLGSKPGIGQSDQGTRISLERITEKELFKRKASAAQPVLFQFTARIKKNRVPYSAPAAFAVRGYSRIQTV